MNNNEKQRFVVYALRHNPNAIPVYLDNEGYCDVEELLANMRITMDELDSIVEQSGGRLVFSEDGSKIRAAHGHSVHIDYRFSDIPPNKLYHGTATRFVQSIKKSGLLPMNRSAVHLSESRDTAVRIGLRHSRNDMLGVTVIEIDTEAMLRDGFKFHRSEDGVWLVEKVPTRYMSFK